jgi:hypothetical protein
MIDAVLGIFNSLGLYTYLILLEIPSIIGSIWPGPGTAAGASLGQTLNS